jgi:hypothetical protein
MSGSDASSATSHCVFFFFNMPWNISFIAKHDTANKRNIANNTFSSMVRYRGEQLFYAIKATTIEWHRLAAVCSVSSTPFWIQEELYFQFLQCCIWFLDGVTVSCVYQLSIIMTKYLR